MQPVKLGQKAVAVKAIYYLLASFRQNKRPNFLAFKRTENIFVLFFTQKKIAIQLII